MRVCTGRSGDNDLLLWYKGIQIPYRGDMNVTDVASWAKKITDSRSQLIETVEQLKNLVE
jgi:hypothetical protein